MVTLRNLRVMVDEPTASLGGRLRAIRQQQSLSLHAVEQRSAGRWKAVVVGSYERGDRAITVTKLMELADFYGVPVTQLLPEGELQRSNVLPLRKVVINLEAMAALPADVVGPLSRFVASIQAKRGDYNGRVLTIRTEDLETVALLYNRTVADTLQHLTTWGVVNPLD